MFPFESLANATLANLAQTAIKSSLMILLAAAVNLAFRRRSAALRHLVWTAAVASVLVIALLGPWLPAWRVVAAPQRWAKLAKTNTTQPSTLQPSTHDAQLSATRSSASESPTVTTTPPTKVAKASPALAPEEVSVHASNAASATDSERAHQSPSLWIAGIWLLGALLLLVRYGASSIRLRALLRCAQRLLEPEWIALEQGVSRAYNITRPVSLLTSDRVDVPITWGVVYPRVVLPTSAESWSSARRLVVLGHELAHVKRLDAATQWIAFAATVVCWFNPLVWFAVRHMRFERERACDDFVLANGTRPAEYATDLLEIVSSFGNSEKYRVALAMARRSQFEGRLLALLDPALEHRFLSRGACAAVVIAALAMIIPVAAAHIAQQPDSVPIVASTPQQPASPSQPANPEEPAPPAEEQASADEEQSPAPTPAPAPEPALAAPSASNAVAPVAATAASPTPRPQVAPAPSAPAKPASTPAPGAPPSRMFNSGMFVACNNATQRNVSRHEDDGRKRWEVTIRGAECSVDMRAEGDVRFKPDFSGVESIPSGGYLTIKTNIRGESNELDVRPSAGSLAYTYTRNGSRMQMDAAAQKWLSDFLVELDRSSAFAVDTRLPQLLAQGGPARVLQETALMGDYARSVYIAALMKNTRLSPTDAREVVRQASTTTSDYYSSQMLMAIADKYSLDDPNIGESFVSAINHLQSDYYHAEVLKRFVDKSQSMSKQRADALLRSAANIHSDYYVSEVLKLLANKQLIASDAWGTYLEAAQKVGSDYYRSEVLRVLMQSYSGDPAIVERSILAAEKIGSDYYKLEVLRSARDRFKIEGPVRDAYVRVARTIQSETYRNQALAGLVSSGVL
jgi:beta-lactamase regulating signal transducer with metallopeptidase domain